VHASAYSLEAAGILAKMKRRRTARDADAARESLASEAKAIENEEVVAKAKSRRRSKAKPDSKDTASKAEAEARAATK